MSRKAKREPIFLAHGPSEESIVAAWVSIEHLVENADSPSVDDLCRLRRELKMHWLCLHWIRNQLVKARKAGCIKEWKSGQ